jgi:hypothetical protein
LGQYAILRVRLSNGLFFAATNVQFMVKDSRKYAATEGWGFAQFKDGKPKPAAALKAVSRATSRLKLATVYSPATHLIQRPIPCSNCFSSTLLM